MDPPQDFKSLQDQIQAALIAATRTAGQLSSEDLGFHRSLNPEVGTILDEQSARLLVLSNQLLKSAASISETRSSPLQDIDDVDNNWRGVVDVVDSLLEKADASLDEYTGVIKRKSSPIIDQTGPLKSKKSPYSLGNSFRTQNLVKPQLAFVHKPDNNDITPWKPLLTSKPHASIPLDQSLRLESGESGHPQYQHPYETEILNLQYPAAIYQKANPIPFLPVDTTTATFVDTYEGVLEMLKDLKMAREIAVDLEHHDARSYVGLVSLMQISIREKDWIVDTLKPWRQDLRVLNEVFTDPKILKVFHGAYMDIVWLQRDLGLYITGLFDTHHACRVLGYPGGSLAYLLKRFIDFDADKKYQMADWRIRPLPEEMFFYARADTHFLLYIYDNLRNELIDRSDTTNPEEDRLQRVLQKSQETSLLRFERQIYDEETGKGPGGWLPLLIKTPALLNNEQFAVFRAVHAWRDKIARKDDDSTNFVMPNHVIFTIAKLMPTDMSALFAAVHPISHNVKSRIGELLSLIKSAKLAGVDGPSMMDVIRPDSVTSVRKSNGSSTKPVEAGQSTYHLVVDGPLRSDKSKFWGGAFGSSVWEPPSGNKINNGLRLAVPLPPLSADAFATISADGLTDRSRKVGESVNSQEIARPAPVQEEPFVVKAGKKRKPQEMTTDTVHPSPDAAEEGPTGDYDISLHEEEEEEAAQRAARKADRRAQKKLAKAQRKLAERGVMESAEDDEGEEEEEEDFDYSKAEPVLHGKRDRVDGNTSKRKKPFDPYAKSSDAPKGMRRLQTERPGKSHTFRS